MTRKHKRFIKDCMGYLGMSRNEAERVYQDNGGMVMSKPLFCRLGIHKIDKEGFVKVYRRRSDRHGGKYSSNYAICKRCGCLCYRLKFLKRRMM